MMRMMRVMMMMRRRMSGAGSRGRADRGGVFRHHFRRTASWGIPTRERRLSRRGTGAKMGSEADADAAGNDAAAAAVVLLQDGPRVGVVQFPHVLLQIEIAAKALATQTASEWLLVVVSMHVERQVVNLV